jgi:hypothetical protein
MYKMFTNEDKLTEFELVRKEFYRVWFLAHQVSSHARQYKREGKEDEFRAAMSAFRMLSKQAKEVYQVMDSLREPRPSIIDTDVCVEEDMRLTQAELFLPPGEVEDEL